MIEIMIVIAIIAILVTIAVPVFNRTVDEARTTSADQELRTLQNEITTYLSKNGTLPASLDDLEMGPILDPWGRPYEYLLIDLGGGKGRSGKGEFRKDRFLVPINTDYDLYSLGKDGKSASPLTAKISHDDIIRANNGAYFGLAANY